MSEHPVSRSMSLCWFPSFECNLYCAHCSARALPNDTHGSNRSADHWIEAFNSCPFPIEQVAITGGEPTVYKPLRAILEATDWKFTMDSNLVLPLVDILPESAKGRLVALNAGLQWHPERDEATLFFDHLHDARAAYPNSQVVVVYVATQRDTQDEWDMVQALASSHGAEFRLSTYDGTYLMKDRDPAKPGIREVCGSGYDNATLLPDGTLYRCIGHAYYAHEPLGNVIDDGWGCLLDGPDPCDRLLCTICDQADKSGVS